MHTTQEYTIYIWEHFDCESMESMFFPMCFWECLGHDKWLLLGMGESFLPSLNLFKAQWKSWQLSLLVLEKTAEVITLFKPEVDIRHASVI